MILLSFNSSKSRAKFDKFTLNWYKTMFYDRNIVSALYNTLTIALFSSIVAMIIGTLSPIAINNMGKKSKNFYLKSGFLI